MQTETIQQKAMQDIFALDEAVSQFESFGSQLDLDLPTVEDDAPKGFDDLLEVNPSNEPTESGEYFMSEGDDLQDKQTQKFVVDEFAKEAAKLPSGDISAADITGISAIIQMNNHITGDVRSFIQQTIDHAVQAQQQQNVSDAQPNGTVAQDIAKTGEADSAPVEQAGEIPAMEPIDPTAEPALDTNPDDGLGLGLDTGLGEDLGAGMDDLGASIDEGEPGTEDLGAGMDDLGASLDAEAGEGEGKPGADEDGFAELDAEPDPDAGETKEAGSDDAAADDLDSFLDSDEGDENSSDTEEDKGETESDDDFNFEAIATKAHGLLENTENAGTEAGEQQAIDASTEAGEQQATEDVGGEEGGDETPVEGSDAENIVSSVLDNGKTFVECGQLAAASAGSTETTDETKTELTDDAETPDETKVEKKVETVESIDFSAKEAQVESIITQAKMKMAAEKAKTVLESYHKERDRANTLAKLDGVVNNLKKTVLTESIIKNFAKESKKRAALESAADKMISKKAKKSVVESTMGKIDGVLKSAKQPSVKAQANKVIAEFEASQQLGKKLNGILESIGAGKKPVDPRQKKIDSILEGVSKKVTSENKLATKLNGILEGVEQSVAAAKKADDFEKKLDAIVAEVKNA